LRHEHDLRGLIFREEREDGGECREAEGGEQYHRRAPFRLAGRGHTKTSRLVIHDHSIMASRERAPPDNHVRASGILGRRAGRPGEVREPAEELLDEMGGL
jgi:hypothetical protein